MTCVSSTDVVEDEGIGDPADGPVAYVTWTVTVLEMLIVVTGQYVEVVVAAGPVDSGALAAGGAAGGEAGGAAGVTDGEPAAGAAGGAAGGDAGGGAGEPAGGATGGDAGGGAGEAAGGAAGGDEAGAA